MRLKIGAREFSPALWPSVIFAVLFVFLFSLGNWQMSRAQEKQVLLDAKHARQAAPAVDLRAYEPDIRLDRFRAADVTGWYVPGQQWLLDNRVYEGLPGYHVFSLFESESGRRLLVNRGWVAVGESRSILPLLPLPEGKVVLKGNLDFPESVGLILGEQPVESLDSLVLLQNLDIEVLGRARGLELLPMALVLAEQQPGSLQYDWLPVEAISPEKHLGYAVQWYALATALLIIFIGVNTRRIEGEFGE